MDKRMLVYAYYARNTGDDLFLKVLFDRYPDTTWDLLTANTNYREIFKDYQNVNIIYSYREVFIGRKKFNLFFKLNELLFNFKKYDGFILIGGSIFMQSPAWLMKFNERAYLLDKFKQAGKKVYVLGANFGPFGDERFVSQYRELLAKFDDVCFRDAYSYNLFKELPNVRLAPDVVFNLKVDNQVKKERSIGFSLIDLEKREGLKTYSASYQKKVAQLIDAYSRKGYAIKLFSFCENEGDLQIIKRIKADTNEAFLDKVTVFNYQGNLPQFLREFQACESIIGTRFHSIILAILFNQPFFPIVYSNKTFNLLSDLKLTGNYCRIENMESLDVDHAIASLNENRVTERNKLFAEAGRQFERLDIFMNEEKLMEVR